MVANAGVKSSEKAFSLIGILVVLVIIIMLFTLDLKLTFCKACKKSIAFGNKTISDFTS